jgi:hypothetical protein
VHGELGSHQAQAELAIAGRGLERGGEKLDRLLPATRVPERIGLSDLRSAEGRQQRQDEHSQRAHGGSRG